MSSFRRDGGLVYFSLGRATQKETLLLCLFGPTNTVWHGLLGYATFLHVKKSDLIGWFGLVWFEFRLLNFKIFFKPLSEDNEVRDERNDNFSVVL